MKNLFKISLLLTFLFTLFSFNSNNENNKLKNNNSNVTKVSHTSKVTVYKNGRPYSCKVSLGFPYGGVTERFLTDSDGVAYVEHGSSGTAKIYIDGNWSKYKLKGKFPGNVKVNL